MRSYEAGRPAFDGAALCIGHDDEEHKDPDDAVPFAPSSSEKEVEMV